MDYSVMRTVNGDLFAAGWRIEEIDECNCDFGDSVYGHHSFCGIKPVQRCLPVVSPGSDR